MKTKQKQWPGLDALFALLVFALLFLLSFRLGSPAAALDSESSWKEVLTYAALHNWRTGVDLTLNYGPLTPFLYPFAVYEPSLFGMFFIAQLLRALLFAGACVGAAFGLCRGFERWLCVLCAVFLCASQPGDTAAFLIILVFSFLLDRALAQSTTSLFGCIICFLHPFVFSAFTYEKFTYGVLLAFCMGVLLLVTWFSRRRFECGCLALGYVCGLVFWWLLVGERLLDLIPFVCTSLSSSAHYSAAMAYGNNAYELKLALLIWLSLIVLSLLSLCANGFRKSLAGVLICLAVVFLAWKAGFVRHDAHSLKFFATVPLIPFLFVLPSYGIVKWLGAFCRVAVLVLATLGFLEAQKIAITKHVTNVVAQPPKAIRRLIAADEIAKRYERQKLEFAKELALPNLSQIIGDSSVDVVTYHQGVLFRNAWKYAPRPVFQSHNAFSPGLLELNKEFFKTDAIPDFVLLHLDPMDGRLPLQADSETFFALLCRYKPRAVEKRFVLFEKLPVPNKCYDSVPLKAYEPELGEEVLLPDSSLLTLATDMELSAFGRLVGLAYRLPEVYINLYAADGAHYRFRYLPTLEGKEALLSPLVTSTEGFLALAAGVDGNPRVSRISFDVESSSSILRMLPGKSFFSKISVSIRKRSFPQHTDTEYLFDTDYAFVTPYGSLPILSFSYPARPEQRGDSTLLMVHPFGRLSAWAGRGDCSLSFKYGMLNNAFSSTNSYPSDGALFSVFYKTHLGLEPVFRHEVTPQMSDEKGGFNGSASAFVSGPGGVLVFQTEKGAKPSSDDMSDWTYWSNLQLDCS